LSPRGESRGLFLGPARPGCGGVWCFYAMRCQPETASARNFFQLFSKMNNQRARFVCSNQ
ncbi:MAG: hypothetical protein LC641_14025, partial [Spirochaeta sp.]|nr:hypothetical protein [Spirochaeta sp.]